MNINQDKKNNQTEIKLFVTDNQPDLKNQNETLYSKAFISNIVKLVANKEKPNKKKTRSKQSSKGSL